MWSHAHEPHLGPHLQPHPPRPWEDVVNLVSLTYVVNAGKMINELLKIRQFVWGNWCASIREPYWSEAKNSEGRLLLEGYFDSCTLKIAAYSTVISSVAYTRSKQISSGAERSRNTETHEAFCPIELSVARSLKSISQRFLSQKHLSRKLLSQRSLSKVLKNLKLPA